MEVEIGGGNKLKDTANECSVSVYKEGFTEYF
jgi:hypothetical protein